MYPSIFGTKTYGRITQNAGTKIVRTVEPSKGAFTSLLYTEVIVAATAHILTVMKPLGSTTVAEAITASDTTWVLAADPGDYTGYCRADNALAGSDYLVLELDDGTFVTDTVSSLATLTATMTVGTAANQTAAVGNRIWFYGVETDVNPFDGLAHARFTLAASGTTIYGDESAASINGWFVSNRREEPLVLVIDNGTNASTLERVMAGYTTKAGRTWNRTTADSTFVPSLA